ncbi:MAG TPA: CvpA family protein [Acidobacteriaceae bacterium]|nr:CvpA family protein [Acidobacteriaceae bacterium]
MTWIDWAIVAVLLGATIGGLVQGFLRTACSLAGLFLGLSIAAWNYHFVANSLILLIHSEAVSNIVSFLLIAVLVMAACNVLGNMLARTMEWMGLGCLDMVFGGVLGFAQGFVLVTILLLGIVAFFPKTDWMAGAKLPPMFFGACRVSTRITPSELTDKVMEGLRALELETKSLLQQKNGVS